MRIRFGWAIALIAGLSLAACGKTEHKENKTKTTEEGAGSIFGGDSKDEDKCWEDYDAEGEGYDDYEALTKKKKKDPPKEEPKDPGQNDKDPGQNDYDKDPGQNDYDKDPGQNDGKDPGKGDDYDKDPGEDDDYDKDPGKGYDECKPKHDDKGKDQKDY
ncbi:MAG: hypothetical protein ACOH5I_09735 [Oligoflexus sp.]